MRLVNLLSKLGRIYYYLGLSAIISTTCASIGSLLVFLIYEIEAYLLYAVVWGLIAIIDYIVWRSPPKQGLRNLCERKECGALRESAELVAIINYLSNRRDEYGVAWRLDSLLSKVDLLSDIIYNCCGAETHESFINYMNNPGNEDLASETIRMLHECMIRNECKSNVSIEEK